MVYSTDIFSNTSLSIQNFTAQNTNNNQPTSCPLTNSNNRNTQPKVAVYWNGCGVHTITGPTPLIEISKNVTRLENGIPTVVTTKINLIGKIFVNEPQNNDDEVAKIGNIKNLMASVTDLEKLFKVDKDSKSVGCGDLRVVCCSAASNGGAITLTDLYALSGVRVVDISFTKTDNNWTNYIDYNVALEHLGSLNTWNIKEYQDSWNIESLEDYTYTDFTVTAPQKSEWNNPNLKPTPPSTSAQQPQATPVGGRNAQSDATLRVLNYPRFKVSHTVSAVGLPKPSGSTPGYCVSTGLPTPNSYAPIEIGEYSAFHQAKKFVEDRASIVLGPSTISNQLWSSLSGGFLYNHVRSVRADIGNASYEVTDTFLGMPTGIQFLEDYDVEVTTDQTYIYTVRVKGEVKGLTVADPALFDKPIMVTGASPSKNPSPSSDTGSSLLIDAKAINDKGLNASLTHSIADVGVASAANQLTANAYQNAASGWINDIKPYLYRRACMFMHSSDRRENYYPPLSQRANNPPNNPIYSKHNVLNIVPISTSEGHNPKAGTITYSYEFNNKFTIISGVVYENISIEDNGPTDIIAEAFVLGRALGPILQNMGTTTSAKKSVTIEVGVVPPTTMNGYFINSNECPVWTGGSVYTTINQIIEGLKPFGDRDGSVFGAPTTAGSRPATNMPGLVFRNKDDYSWDASTGKFVRSVGWTYQQCNNSRTWFDN
jgi:hypothetical protein